MSTRTAQPVRRRWPRSPPRRRYWPRPARPLPRPARPVSSGTWGTAEEVPGTAALNQGGIATINSVSCATADTCGAGGSYLDSSGHF